MERKQPLRQQIQSADMERLYLNYFNNYLFEHGTISENEYKRMTEKIAEKTARYSPLKKAR